MIGASILTAVSILTVVIQCGIDSGLNPDSGLVVSSLVVTTQSPFLFSCYFHECPSCTSTNLCLCKNGWQRCTIKLTHYSPERKTTAIYVKGRIIAETMQMTALVKDSVARDASLRHM